LVSYGDYEFQLDGITTIPEGVKLQTNALNDCIVKKGQPEIILRNGGGSSLSSDGTSAFKIYLDVTETHETLFIHEYVHYLDETLYPFEYPCAKDLYSRIEYGTGTLWGDPPGFPYCYHRTVPNHKEYLAILFEGWCKNECGPTRDYYNTTTNAIALEQKACILEFTELI
jgi:hypothetical protein